MAESKETTKTDPLNSFKALIEKRESAFVEYLNGDKITAKRFIRIAITAVAENPKLLACTQSSLIRCFYKAAQYNLEPNTPEELCYVIPYEIWNPITRKKEKTAQFQLGYHGVCELAYRSDQVKAIRPRVIYANDNYKISYGLDEELKHDPAMGERGEPLGVYSVVVLENDVKHFVFMSMAECLEHAKKFSKSWAAAEKEWDGKPAKKDSTWHTNPEAMALKTVVIASLKYMPKSVVDKRLSDALLDDRSADQNELLLSDDSTIDVRAEVVSNGDDPAPAPDAETGELPMEGE